MSAEVYRSSRPLGRSLPLADPAPGPRAGAMADAQSEFPAFFSAELDRVVRTVALIVGDRAQAEDIAQDAFVQLLGHWSKVSRYEQPDAWVRRVAIRLATRTARRERLRQVLETALRRPEVAPLVPEVELRPDPPGVLGSSVEPSLAGTYAVVVAASPAADSAGMTGRWTVLLDPSGEVVMTAPDGFRGTTSGSTYRVDGDLLRVDAFISDTACEQAQSAEPVGTYRWTRSASGLDFTAASETCAARRLLFTGQPWQALP